jgi:branched-chain amino acid transport system substrate-binding protein
MQISPTQWKTAVLLAPAIFCAAASFAGSVDVTDKNPFKIGFVGTLIRMSSDLGIQGRNGVMFAVEETNRLRGINGRPFHLITKDDRQDPQTALNVGQELIDEGVVATIGHINSVMSEATLSLMNEHEIPMIAPTTSSKKRAEGVIL